MAVRANLDAIIVAMDQELERTRKSFLTPMEANAALAKAGVLKDDPNQPGKRLRILLNKGCIPHAYKVGGIKSQWVIPHSTARRTLDKPYID